MFKKALMAHVAGIAILDAFEEVGRNGLFAFNAQYFDPQGCGTKGNMKVGTYKTSADTISGIEVASYFNDAVVSQTMKTGDILIAQASNATRAYSLTVSGTTVTLGAPPNQAAVVTAVTEAGSAISATTDGDIPALTGNPSAYNSALTIALVDGVRELAKVQAAVITSLKNAKLMALS